MKRLLRSFLIFSLFLYVFLGFYLSIGPSRPFAFAEAQAQKKWVIPKLKKPVEFDFSGYLPDPDISFSFEDRTFKLDSPSLKRGDIIWVPIAELLPELETTFIKIDKDSFIFIRDDGTPLEARVNDTTLWVNKQPFTKIDVAPQVYEGNFMMPISELIEVLRFSYTYDAASDTITISRKEAEEFTTFTIPKPIPPPEEKIAPPPPAMPKLKLKEERLPKEYQPDINLKLNSSWSYLFDKHAHSRTRDMELKLNGKFYNYDLSGNLRMRDRRTGNKQLFEEDHEYLSIRSENMQLKLFDNYLSLAPLRSQSQPYFGGEASYYYDPFRSTFIYGKFFNTIPGPVNVGSVKYFGDLYAFRQGYTDPNDLFNLKGMLLFTENTAEWDRQADSTIYPRRNAVGIFDSVIHVYPGLDVYYTHAVCNYVPDDRRNARFIDQNLRTGLSFKQERFSASSFYEYVGAQYASIGVPATYQDYKSWNGSTSFKLTKEWTVSVGGKIGRDNVEEDSTLLVNRDRSGYVSNSFFLPWNQTFNFTYFYSQTTSDGPDFDLTGSKYNDYRFDYVKTLDTWTFQWGYEYYRLEPMGLGRGGTYAHSHTFSVFKYFPNLLGSYVRYFQDIRKTKNFAPGNYTTTTINNTLGARYYLTEYLSANADVRVVSTLREEFDDTEIATVMLGAEFKAGPDTKINIDYTLSNYNILNEEQTIKEYTILCRLRHVFGIKSPEKWGRVKAHVFKDLNSNGKFDRGEPGIPDIRAYVVDGRFATTDSSGIALIQKVVPGIRNVRIDTMALPLQVVVRGPDERRACVKPFRKASVEFPVVTTGTIKGYVFLDVDEDGKFDKLMDSPIPNARVYLMPGERDTLTFSDGSFIFDYAYPGEYEVFVDPKSVSKDYKLSSSEKYPVSLKEKEVIEEIDFYFKPKPIEVQYF